MKDYSRIGKGTRNRIRKIPKPESVPKVNFLKDNERKDELVSNTKKNQGDSCCGFDILVLLPKKRFCFSELQGLLSGCRLLRPKLLLSNCTQLLSTSRN